MQSNWSCYRCGTTAPAYPSWLQTTTSDASNIFILSVPRMSRHQRQVRRCPVRVILLLSASTFSSYLHIWCLHMTKYESKRYLFRLTQSFDWPSLVGCNRTCRLQPADYVTTNRLECFGRLQCHSFNDHSLSLPLRLVLLLSLHPSSGTLFLLTLDLQTVSHVLNVDWNLNFLRLLTPPRTSRVLYNAIATFRCDFSFFSVGACFFPASPRVKTLRW